MRDLRFLLLTQIKFAKDRNTLFFLNSSVYIGFKVNMHLGQFIQLSCRADLLRGEGPWVCYLAPHGLHAWLDEALVFKALLLSVAPGINETKVKLGKQIRYFLFQLSSCWKRWGGKVLRRGGMVLINNLAQDILSMQYE